ncbi:uncharacterized protein LOC114542086 [Dendronephthya gigantea]|uniref:uncharacterized protein LOC114542086 n=1 Tax=Dendronephthya gigantea TaxID=151771 RepID=UPI001069C18A|nr:uncharacterized protein LOC114542086 [Dendronephthya gigantea]
MINEFDSNEENSLTCNCGVMAKSKQKDVSKSCDPQANMPSCSCVKNGKKCSRKCRCIMCINSQDLKKTVADGKMKGCTCGRGKKGVFCQDRSTRKSKCPCLKRNIYCSYRCDVKRKRSHPETYKRVKGVEYLANNGFEIFEGPWTKLESFILLIVLEVIKCAGLSLVPNNIIELYNFFALSKVVKEMNLPISYKSTKRILGKLKYINSKHSVFKTFMDEKIDHF